MTSFIQRDPVMYSLLPLSAKETMNYLHARMQEAGSERADTIFPFDVCDRLRQQSDGWPGKLNEFALEAVKRSVGFPVSMVDTYAPGEVIDETGLQIPVLAQDAAVNRIAPKLIISRDGRTAEGARHHQDEKSRRSAPPASPKAGRGGAESQ
ncbi:MAG: hypothetical protein OEM25_04820 [Gammaproteobacteria bacterium]|nr:hypothetical protein [Gammaproteobacteria bacterium]